MQLAVRGVSGMEVEEVANNFRSRAFENEGGATTQ
jgi:hypothetical protein